MTYFLTGPNAGKSYAVSAQEQKTDYCEKFINFGVDGKTIIFNKGTGDADGQSYLPVLYIMTPDRVTSHDFEGYADAWQLAYTHDKQSLVYWSMEKPGLYVKKLSTGVASQIVTNLEISSFILTPDGKQILFTGHPPMQ